MKAKIGPPVYTEGPIFYNSNGNSTVPEADGYTGRVERSGPFNRLADHRFQPFRSAAPGVAEIDFMVAAAAVQVKRAAVFHGKPAQRGNGGGLVVIGAQVHTLHTEALLRGKVFYSRKILFLFLRRLVYGPVKHLRCDKVRQAEHGHPFKIFLARIINAANAHRPSSGGTT